METNFAPTFFDSVKRMVNRQRWYWKTWDFLRYDMPRFFRNLWMFRKDLYNYRWYSGQNAVLPFMKTSLVDMAAKIDERGIEVEHSKSKKLDKMRRAAYLMERFIEDDFLDDVMMDSQSDLMLLLASALGIADNIVKMGDSEAKIKAMKKINKHINSYNDYVDFYQKEDGRT